MVNFQGYTLVKEQQEVSSSIQLFIVKNDTEQNFLVKRLKKTNSEQPVVRFKNFLALQSKLTTEQVVAPLECYYLRLTEYEFAYSR
mgnify:FL=1